MKKLLSSALMFMTMVGAGLGVCSCSSSDDDVYVAEQTVKVGTAAMAGNYVGSVKVVGFVDDAKRAYVTVERKAADAISFKIECEAFDMDINPITLTATKNSDGIWYLGSEANYAVEGSFSNGTLCVTFRFNNHVFFFYGTQGTQVLPSTTTKAMAGEYVGNLKLNSYSYPWERAYVTLKRKADDAVSFELTCEALNVEYTPVVLVGKRNSDGTWTLTSESKYAIDGCYSNGVLTVIFRYIIGGEAYTYTFTGKK